MDAHDPPPPEARDPQPVARDFSPAKKYGLSDYLFQFITITAGVLIALLVNGFVELRDTRSLVRQARATIAQEIAENKKELEGTLSSYESDLKNFDNALKLANDLLKTKTTTIRSIDFHVDLAELSSAGWRTAERTGALSHMDYSEVQQFSALYDFQDLFSERQREIVGQLASATAILSDGFDPANPNLKDLEVFRQQLMAVRSSVTLSENLGRSLAKKYTEFLAR